MVSFTIHDFKTSVDPAKLELIPIICTVRGKHVTKGRLPIIIGVHLKKASLSPNCLFVYEALCLNCHITQCKKIKVIEARYKSFDRSI